MKGSRSGVPVLVVDSDAARPIGSFRSRALVLCLVLALGACTESGGDTLLADDDPTAPSRSGLGTVIGSSSDPVGFVSGSSGTEPSGTGEGEPGMTDEMPDEVPGGTVPSIDPDGDDRPGLAVEGLSGQSLDDAVSPWLVNARFFRNVSRESGTGDANIDLIPYRNDFPVARHVDFYEPVLETCTLNLRDEVPAEGEGNGQSEDTGPLAISGGSFVTINTDAGVWAVIGVGPLDEGGEELVYNGRRGLPGGLPDDATLSIPGNAFPSVTAFPLPDEPPVPVRLLPATDEAIGPGTLYSWMPGEGNDYIILDFLAFNPALGERDFPVFCLVVDDGSFELPDDARDFLVGLGEEIELRYARARDVVTFANGIVFRTRISVAE